MLKEIKSLFGFYDIGYEYYVPISNIKVPISYKSTKVEYKKWMHKIGYYFRTGQFESPILLHRDFSLYDGFSSMKIAYVTGLDKVPVYFVD